MSAGAPTYRYTILAVGVGNALEWYDFAIFGALSDVFGDNFFPIESRGAQLMAAFSVYCSAFFMRPVGGFIFGRIGDTYGRKKALEVSVGMMIITSFFIGLLPTYEMAGYGATCLIVLLRMLQGVAVGGEMVGAYIYTVEGCPDKWVAFWSGVCKSTALFGTVLGMGFVALLRECLQQQQFNRWGWRVPFLSSFLMGSIGAYLRSFLKESEEFLQNRTEKHQQPRTSGESGVKTAKYANLIVTTATTWDVFYIHWPEMICVGLIVSFWAAGFYTSFIWMAYYTTELMAGEAVPRAWLINTAMMSVFVAMLPIAGLFADFVCHFCYEGATLGYRRCMKGGALLVVICACPIFYLMNMKSTWSVCAGYALLSLGLALYACCLPVVIVNQFSVKYRYTSLGIAYNVANAVFAGTAPLIQTFLVLHVHTPYALVDSAVIPALLLIVVGLLSSAVLTWGEDFCQHLRRVYHMRDFKISCGNSTSALEMSAVMDSSSSSECSIDSSRAPMIKC